METQQQQLQSINVSSSQANLALEGTDTLNLPKLPPATEIESEFFERLPSYLGRFFQDYKQALITVGLILAAIVTVKIALAALDAIHDIPLFSPIFELIGISYATWFVYRYLIKASTRQELSEEIRLLKNEFLGE
jgi:CAAD domains of cyanobacterial aminoacyl-tRNA synthetase